MLKISPTEIPTSELHAYMLAAVSPRPIAFASTVDVEGNVNLSPFSFFNAFGSNPPTLIFSPARRVRDNTTKHTLENAIATKEVVINTVNYAMVEQMSLASTEYERGVNEFVKSGLTAIASEIVKPPRVAESPVQFECKVTDVVALGQQGGAGNLIICEILLVHIDEAVLNDKKQIDPHKIDLVARMGADYYCRASGNAVFEVAKPLLKKGIGVDQLPLAIRNSRFLTGNNLGKLANVERIPTLQELALVQVENVIGDENKHRLAHQLLDQNKLMEAWKVLLND